VRDGQKLIAWWQSTSQRWSSNQEAAGALDGGPGSGAPDPQQFPEDGNSDPHAQPRRARDGRARRRARQAAYLLKSRVTDVDVELIHTLERIVNGTSVAIGARARAVAARPASTIRSTSFSPREREVLSLRKRVARTHGIARTGG